MAMKKCYFIYGSIFASLILLAIGALAFLPKPDVSEATFSRIKDGMTMKEVEVIMGRPSIEPIRFGHNEMLITRVEWKGSDDDGDDVLIVVEFSCQSGHERVHTSVRSIVEPDPLSPLDKLRHLFSDVF
ncbi:MAG: hypothetical protein EXR98_08575 [Gemmataceae bacterium]|nr:hypothetical protein [Gemmataceae bacterium]